MKNANSLRSRSNTTMTCGTCGTSFYLDETDSPPFCSERCKLVDLKRWIDEEISLPHEGGPDEPQEAIDQLVIE